MKTFILSSLLLFGGFAQAQGQSKGSLEDFTLEYQFNEEMGVYKIWSVGSDYFITHLNTEDFAPAPEKKEEATDEKKEGAVEEVKDKLIQVSQEKLEFIRSKVEEIMKLKNVDGCGKRKISASFKIDNKTESKSACLDGSDPLSKKLNQLSATLMILL